MDPGKRFQSPQNDLLFKLNQEKMKATQMENPKL